MRLPALALGAVVLLVVGSARANPVDDLKPGEWYEVPSSHMRAVDPCPGHDCSYSGAEGQAAVIDDWSGGAYDTKRDRLLVWGGGHAGYGGNELYAFDLGTLTWSRLTNPSDPPGVDVPYAPDGNPTSRHTYDYLQYVPAIDSLCSFGGAGFYSSGQTQTGHTDCYDFEAGRWRQHPDRAFLGTNIGAFSAVDPTSGHAWAHGCGGYSSLAELDPVADAWLSHGGMWTETVYPQYNLTAAIDPVGRVLVAVGGGQAFTWDLSKPGDVAGAVLSTSGDPSIVHAPSPGFAYDPAIHAFVGWSGGSDVFTLDPTTWTWTRVAPSPTNVVTPTAAQQWGTFGRFRYSATRNVFVVVSSVDQDVYVYKLSAGGGTPADGGAASPAADGGSGSDGDAPEGGSQVDGGNHSDAGNPSSGAGCACRAAPAGGSTGSGAPLLFSSALLLALTRANRRVAARNIRARGQRRSGRDHGSVRP